MAAPRRSSDQVVRPLRSVPVNRPIVARPSRRAEDAEADDSADFDSGDEATQLTFDTVDEDSLYRSRRMHPSSRFVLVQGGADDSLGVDGWDDADLDEDDSDQLWLGHEDEDSFDDLNRLDAINRLRALDLLSGRARTAVKEPEQEAEPHRAPHVPRHSEPRPEQRPSPRPSRSRASVVVDRSGAVRAPLLDPEASSSPDEAPAPRRPLLRVVSRPASVDRQRQVRTMVVLFTVFVGLVCFVAVAMHAQIAQQQGRLEALRSDASNAKREHDRLRSTAAELEAPEHIVAAAERLGLVAPRAVSFVPIEDPDVSTNSNPDVSTNGNPVVSTVPAGSRIPSAVSTTERSGP